MKKVAIIGVMTIVAIIGVVLGTIIGINLLAPINNAVDEVAEGNAAVVAAPAETTTEVVEEATEEASGAVSSLLGLLLILMVVIILLVAFRVVGAGEKERKEPSPKSIQKGLIVILEEASEKLGEFVNNLDVYLGIKTANSKEVEGLVLDADNTLRIDDKSYHWYLVDKNEDLPMFKVVGVSKNPDGENLVYVLGRNEATGMPYLIKISNYYLKTATMNGVSWKEAVEA